MRVEAALGDDPGLIRPAARKPLMESKELEVVLVRHGETEWSRTGRHTGRTDIDLGRRQADQLADMLAGRTFEVAMSSPLLRARETFAHSRVSTEAEINSDLVEWDYGVYEACPRSRRSWRFRTGRCGLIRSSEGSRLMRWVTEPTR